MGSRLKETRKARSLGNDQLPLLLRLEDAFYLPNALARVAQYALENPEKVVRQSQTELAKRAQTGQASVQRLCHELGFKGFIDFKLALAADLATNSIAKQSHAGAGDDVFAQAAHSMSYSISETCAILDNDILERSAARLYGSARVQLFGSGVSGFVAEIVAYRLLRVGVNASVVRDINIAREVAVELSNGSAAIAVSQSGVSLDTIDFISTARDAGCYTLAITCHPEAALGKAADDCLRMARLGEPAYGGHVLDVPRVVFIAEALGLAVDSHRRGEKKKRSG